MSGPAVDAVLVTVAAFSSPAVGAAALASV